MPFSPAANPDLQSQYIFQGITQAGRAIGQGIEDAGQNLSRMSKERKAYLAMADTLAENGQLSKDKQEALKNVDTDTIKGVVEGLITAGKLRQANQQTALTKAQMDALNYNLVEKQREEDAQQRFNELMRQRMAPIGPGPVMLPSAPIEQGEVYDMAAQAGMRLSPVLAETAKAFERYGKPGTATPIEGRSDMIFAWETPHSGVPMPVKPAGTGTPTVRASALPGLGIFTDEMGKSRPVKLDVEAGLGTMGKMQFDSARLELAGIDANIVNTLQQIQQKGSSAKVPKLDDKGNVITGFLGRKQEWSLQEQLNSLLARKASAAAQLESLQRSLLSPGVGPAPIAPTAGPMTNAPAVPAAGLKWRYDDQSGQLVPVQ